MGYQYEVEHQQVLRNQNIKQGAIFIGMSSASLIVGCVMAIISLISPYSAIAIVVGGGGIGCVLTVMKPKNKD